MPARASQLIGYTALSFGVTCTAVIAHRLTILNPLVFGVFIFLNALVVISIVTVPARQAIAKMGNVTPESVTMVGLSSIIGFILGIVAGL